MAVSLRNVEAEPFQPLIFEAKLSDGALIIWEMNEHPQYLTLATTDDNDNDDLLDTIFEKLDSMKFNTMELAFPINFELNVFFTVTFPGGTYSELLEFIYDFYNTPLNDETLTCLQDLYEGKFNPEGLNIKLDLVSNGRLPIFDGFMKDEDGDYTIRIRFNE